MKNAICSFFLAYVLEETLLKVAYVLEEISLILAYVLENITIIIVCVMLLVMCCLL